MIIDLAREKLKALTDERGMDNELITINCRALSPEEAIGNPLHDDYPIQLGKERLIEAEFMGKKGQAFSDSYFHYTGSVKEILSFRLDTNARRAIFISSLNAIMAEIGKMPEALHCKNDDLMRCGETFAGYLDKFAGAAQNHFSRTSMVWRYTTKPPPAGQSPCGRMPMARDCISSHGSGSTQT